MTRYIYDFHINTRYIRCSKKNENECIYYEIQKREIGKLFTFPFYQNSQLPPIKHLSQHFHFDLRYIWCSKKKEWE